MGGELLTSPNGGEQSPPVTYSEVFREYLPFYLSIGMPMGEYWNGDSTLTRVYLKAYEIKKESDNQKMWLQGLYIYEALLCASPVFHDFVKKPKPLPYPEAPYPLSQKAKEEQEKSKEELKMETMLAKTKAWANRVNKKKLGEQSNG